MCEYKSECLKAFDTWIDFLVIGHSVCINNGLESSSEFVDTVECWWFMFGVHAVQDGRD